MIDSKDLFWDSCVFIRYLTRNPANLLPDIDSYVRDAKRKERKIYYSSLIIVEIRPRFLEATGRNIDEFISALGSSFEQIEPNPNVMKWAAQLHDALPTNPHQGEKTNRIVSTPDAIQLATCLFARDVLGIGDLVFHTFDKNGGDIAGEKTVPMIGFERWFPSGTRSPIVERACNLPRCPPEHPQPDLLE